MKITLRSGNLIRGQFASIYIELLTKYGTIPTDIMSAKMLFFFPIFEGLTQLNMMKTQINPTQHGENTNNPTQLKKDLSLFFNIWGPNTTQHDENTSKPNSTQKSLVLFFSIFEGLTQLDMAKTQINPTQLKQDLSQAMLHEHFKICELACQIWHNMVDCMGIGSLLLEKYPTIMSSIWRGKVLLVL